MHQRFRVSFGKTNLRVLFSIRVNMGFLEGLNLELGSGL